MTLPGSNDLEKLHALCDKTYKEQAIWFLNAFWEDFADKEAERLWGYVNKCGEIDSEFHGEGSGLDEMAAHVFLEKFAETLTVRELRAKLRSTGAIGESERPKKVPLTHYLLFRYNADWHVLVNASQGDNSKEIAQAQEMLNKVTAAFEESKRTAAAAAQALREAESSAAKAKTREEESKRAAEQAKEKEEASKIAEQEAIEAQKELEAALAEVKAQEDAYNAKTEELKQKSETGGVVSRNKAANELAQHLAEDPLPLRKAKITAEAAVKRADKATQAASQAANLATSSRADAERAAKEATEARHDAEKAREASARANEAAEAALDDAQTKLEEAEAYLVEVKSKPGCAHGALWWIERELHEQKAYLPESKGGYRKK